VKRYIKLILLLIPVVLYCQTKVQDTIMIGLSIPEVVFSEERDEAERIYSPSRIKKIGASNIFDYAATSSADILQKSGAITIQMSQSGGGSPIIRGFEANRVLVVVDGIRLNNAISRSGHLHNSISISPMMLENVDIIFGPSSVKYGSDAIGGVVHYHTKFPRSGLPNKSTLLHRYSSVNNGINLYYDNLWSKGRFSFLHALSLSRFGNLKMGKNRYHGYQSWGREHHIVEDNEQLRTAYDQVDFMQKIRLNVSKFLSYKFNLQASSTTNLNRFDQLNDLSGDQPKFEEWYYGPQKRFLLGLGIEHQKNTLFYDSFNNTLSYQKLEESRNSQRSGDDLISRTENVFVLANSTDFIKKWDYNMLNYGIDVQQNIVLSKATEGYTSRYADGGSEMTTLSAYSQYKLALSKGSYISAGARYSKAKLNAVFDSANSLGLPYKTIRLADDAITGSLGFKCNMKKGWEGNISMSSGFRSPNVDDVTKVFEKSGKLTVPNNELVAEKSKNIEVTLVKHKNRNEFLCTAYYTILEDAIVKEKFSLNGQDSIMYDSQYLPVYANTNTQKAFIYGFNIEADLHINEVFSSAHSLSYSIGKDVNTKMPMDHIPPLHAKSKINWLKNKHKIELFILFNGWKKLKNYGSGSSDNIEEATSDGTPSWWTLNLSYVVNLNSGLIFQFNLENILDAHYKTFSSGISAPGRNFVVTLKSEF
tara:strand:+ start:3298 stop:5409 length:2112 start_codon:yes stop_codon:yes gene_type:complete